MIDLRPSVEIGRSVLAPKLGQTHFLVESEFFVTRLKNGKRNMWLRFTDTLLIIFLLSLV